MNKLIMTALFALSASIGVNSSVQAAEAFGPDTCKQGYVWREATEGDTVCVTPGERSISFQQNQRAKRNRNPSGGAFGPATCRNGYVWREAFDGDTVCVTPADRERAAQQNENAPNLYENAN